MSRYARGAAILCGLQGFQSFLAARSGRAVVDKDSAARELRDAVGVLSRRELDGNEVAARRYRALIEEFNKWQSQSVHATV